MNINILDDQVQSYIEAHLEDILHQLLLKKSPFSEVSMLEIVEQIKGKKVAKKKFPFLLKEGILFPPHLNLEQASSEITAKYKAQQLQGKRFLDLTCGLGIDALFLSSHFDQITLVEQDPKLLQLVQHNWKILGRNAAFLQSTAQDFLEKNTDKYEVIYLDPARRDAQKNKVFLLEDLSPNVLEIHHLLVEAAKEIIIKLSPLIDIKYLVSVLPSIYKIEIISVHNEVKELVIYLSKMKVSEDLHKKGVKCTVVNLESTEPPFSFYLHEEMEAKFQFSEPLPYIYLPSNGLLKAGVFNLISERFHLKKLHPNTHIYTSQSHLADFPGRVLQMEIVESKAIKKKQKFNIVSKNYPLMPEQIKKKYQLIDGGSQYLLFTQTKKGKIILKSI